MGRTLAILAAVGAAVASAVIIHLLLAPSTFEEGNLLLPQVAETVETPLPDAAPPEPAPAVATKPFRAARGAAPARARHPGTPGLLVVGPDGAPLPHAVVTLWNGPARNPEDRQILTDAAGMVLRDLLPQGQGLLVCRREGAAGCLSLQDAWASNEPILELKSPKTVTVRVMVRAIHAGLKPMVGMLIRTRIGADVYGTNTRLEGIELGPFAADERFAIEFSFQCWLTPQQYTLTVATQNQDGTSQDWLDDVLSFEVVSSRVSAGIADLRAEVAWRALQ